MAAYNRNNSKPSCCKWCGAERSFKFPHYSFCSDNCRIFYERFIRKERRLILVESRGGATELAALKADIKKSCVVCGYNNCQSALELHHINGDKGCCFSSITNIMDFNAELWFHPIIVVCANCHREIHYGMINEWDYEGSVLGVKCECA